MYQVERISKAVSRIGDLVLRSNLYFGICASALQLGDKFGLNALTFTTGHESGLQIPLLKAFWHDRKRSLLCFCGFRD